MISGEQIKLSLHRFRIARFADLAFMSARAIMQACRPVCAPGFSDVGLMGETFPGRVVVLVSAYPLHLRCSLLRVDLHSTTGAAASWATEICNPSNREGAR